MSKIFSKVDIFTFIIMLELTTKLMNMLNYSITTHFILSKKDYHFYRNPHLMYKCGLNVFIGNDGRCQLVELQGSWRL